MRNILFIAIVFFTIVSCKNKTDDKSELVIKQEDTIKEATKKAILDKGCFEYNNNGNVIKIEITEVTQNVTGNLDIAYAEKDANKGTFIGTLNNNKLIGIYKFQSEGTESSREIAFLIKDNKLIEGYGELNEEGTKFKDTSAIKYTSTMPLTKVDCGK